MSKEIELAPWFTITGARTIPPAGGRTFPELHLVTTNTTVPSFTGEYRYRQLNDTLLVGTCGQFRNGIWTGPDETFDPSDSDAELETYVETFKMEDETERRVTAPIFVRPAILNKHMVDGRGVVGVTVVHDPGHRPESHTRGLALTREAAERVLDEYLPGWTIRRYFELSGEFVLAPYLAQ